MKRSLIFLFILLSFVFLWSGCSATKPAAEQKNAGPEKVVYLSQANPADMATKLAAGEIDGFIAWEPFNAQAVLGGQGRYLKQSGELWPDHPCCVLAVREGLTDQKVLEALAWVHIKSTQFINNPENREKVLQYAGEFTGKNESVVGESLKYIKFVEYPDTNQFRTYYHKLAQSGLLKKTYADIGFKDEETFFRNFLFAEAYNNVKRELANDPEWRPTPLPAGTVLTIGYLNRDLHELAIYIGQKEGYYSQVGLVPGQNLKIREYANGVAVMEGFKAKELDASYLGGSPATLKRVNDDIKIRIVAGANNEGSAIVVAPSSPIREIKDFAGKTIAVPAVGTVQYFVVDTALREAGLKPVLK